jgi:flavin reductase (DIM6/NTAB) family NADH-FMN oxidoreductase RutF
VTVMDSRVTGAVPAAELTELFRTAFRGHAAGVAVITAARERAAGFTATSLISVSARPPALAFGIGTASSSWPVFADADHIGVHLLAEDQSELAAGFARSGVDRFAGADWYPGPHGVPLLRRAPARLVCRVVSRVPAGDHHIVVAELEGGEAAGEWRPLLYHGGRFAGLFPMR